MLIRPWVPAVPAHMMLCAVFTIGLVINVIVIFQAVKDFFGS